MKIMFVCHGNICRSPMAECIFKELVKKAGLDGKYLASSSATSNEEIDYDGVGSPVYPPARDQLLKHGLDAGDKRASQLKREDYKKYDYFIGMDSANIRNMSLIFGSDPENKIRRLNEKDVSDPWYTDDFDVAYKEIYRGCVELLENLKGKEIEK